MEVTEEVLRVTARETIRELLYRGVMLELWVCVEATRVELAVKADLVGGWLGMGG